MKLYASTATLLFLVQQARAAEFNRMLQQGFPCVVGSFTFELKSTGCSYDTFKDGYAKIFNDPLNKRVGCTNTIEEDLALHFDTTVAELDTAVADACHQAMDDAYALDYHAISLSSDPDFVKKFYDGQTNWNEHVETLLFPSDGTTPEFVLKEESYNVKTYYDGNSGHARNGKVKWPGDVTNFDLESCELNAAMCCYVKDRQADDGNGNCDNGNNNDQYDTLCVDKDPGDNTDLCMVDYSRAPSSNGIASDGFALFPLNNAEGEGSIHCHGLAWSNDDHHMYSRYKGNNLFYVSMYDHMYKRGYVKNVPGAPMCGCVEQMPIVSRSDCTQTDVTESFKFVRNADEAGFTGEVTAIDVDFNSCQGLTKNNNLENYYERLVSEGLASTDQLSVLRETIVGDNNCDDVISDFFTYKGYAAGFADPDWTYVTGVNNLEEPYKDYTSDLFLRAFNERTNKIVRRVCPDCRETHRDLYYVRLTPIPETMDFLDLFKSVWSNEGNVMGTDFDIYSTYEDALAKDTTKAWKACNYLEDDEDKNPTGFPRDCGPTELVGCQWNSWTRGTCTDARSVAFYLETLETMEINVVPNTKEIGMVYKRGNSLELDDTYYIRGAGYSRYSWGEEDAMHFEASEITGTITMVAKVSDIMEKRYDTDLLGSKAGLMIRESLEKGSKMAQLTLSPKYGVVFNWRLEDDDHCRSSEVVDLIEAGAPVKESWLMLKRYNNMFSAYKSDDGATWEVVGQPIQIDMGDKVFYGQSISSYSSALAEATITNYEVHDSAVIAEAANTDKISIIGPDPSVVHVSQYTLPHNRVEFVIELETGVAGASDISITNSRRMLL